MERNRGHHRPNIFNGDDSHGWVRSETPYQSTDLSEEIPKAIEHRLDVFSVNGLTNSFNSGLPKSCAWSYMQSNGNFEFFQDLFATKNHASAASVEVPSVVAPPLKLRRLRKTRDPAKPDVWTMVTPASDGEVESSPTHNDPPRAAQEENEEGLQISRICLSRYCKRLICLSHMERQSVQEVNELEKLLNDKFSTSTEISLSLRALVKGHMEVDRLLEHCYMRLDETMRDKRFSTSGRFLDTGLRPAPESSPDNRSLQELQRLYLDYFKIQEQLQTSDEI